MSKNVYAKQPQQTKNVVQIKTNDKKQKIEQPKQSKNVYATSIAFNAPVDKSVIVYAEGQKPNVYSQSSVKRPINKHEERKYNNEKYHKNISSGIREMTRVLCLEEDELICKIKEFDVVKGTFDQRTKRRIVSLEPIIVSFADEDNIISTNDGAFEKDKIMMRTDLKEKIVSYYKKYNCAINLSRDVDCQVWRLFIYPN